MLRLNPARVTAISVALLASTSLALSQEPPQQLAGELPEQMTDNPMAPAADATHVARLSVSDHRDGDADDAALEADVAQNPDVDREADGEGEDEADAREMDDRTGTAWFVADAQNNTLSWTIEYAGISATSALISCGDTDGVAGEAVRQEQAMADPDGDGDPDPDVAGDVVAAEADAGAGDPDADAGRDPDADVAMEADLTLSLDGGESPLQGQLEAIEEDVFDSLTTESCSLILREGDLELRGAIVSADMSVGN